MSISWKKFIQIILQFIQINTLRLVVKCAVGLSLPQHCESALNRASLSSVLIIRLDGSRSSLDVLVAHVD